MKYKNIMTTYSPPTVVFENISANDTDNTYPIFVSLYTTNNGYEEYALKLIESLNKFKLPYYVEGVTLDSPKWNLVTKFKPFILLKVMDIYNRSVIWIDADAKIEKLPVFFKQITKDFAVHYVRNKTVQLASGLCYFANNKIGKDILNDWINENKAYPKIFDQVNLQKVITLKYKKNEQLLPKEYLCIYDHPQYKDLDWVISQWQASRTLKKD